jgi:hypothetical protein
LHVEDSAYFPGGQVSDDASALAVTSLAEPGVSMAAVFALVLDKLMVVSGGRML